MIRQLTRWLGKERAWFLIGSLISTGLASLSITLLASDESWALPAQTILVVVFLAGVAVVVGSRMERQARLKLGITIGPALGLVLLGLVLPGDVFPLIVGAAFGWLIAAQFVIRDRMPSEYKQAIKHLRKQEYKDAAKVVTRLVNQEPNNVNHVQFRAEMYRLGGQVNKAIKDYEKAIQIAPDQAAGYNGLAEIYLQQRKYSEAHQYALDAYQREPDYWVAPYNLGMIEDRLGDNAAVIEHLNIVLDKGLPDSRHRLLTHLWLARAHHRMGNAAATQQSIEHLKAERRGLREWKIILHDDQAAALRDALSDDIELAERAFEDGVTPADLFNGGPN